MKNLGLKKFPALVANTRLAALLMALFANPYAHAAVEISVAQDNTDVVFNYGGTLDLSGLTKVADGNGFAFVAGDDGLGFGAIAFGVGFNLDAYLVPSLPSFSTVLFQFALGSGTGSGVSMFAHDTQTSASKLGVPDGYISGNPLAGTLTLSNETFATLGLVDGVYQSNLVSGDHVRLTIGAPIPLPASLPLLTSVVGLISVMARKGQH